VGGGQGNAQPRRARGHGRRPDRRNQNAFARQRLAYRQRFAIAADDQRLDRRLRARQLPALRPRGAGKSFFQCLEALSPPGSASINSRLL